MDWRMRPFLCLIALCGKDGYDTYAMSQKTAPATSLNLKDPAVIKQLERYAVKSYLDGNYPDSFGACFQCILADPDNNQHKIRFAHILDEITFTSFDPNVKKTIHICLRTRDVEHQKFQRAWREIIGLDPFYKDLMPMLEHGNTQTFDAAFDWRAFQVIMQDEFFVSGLRMFVPINPKIELFLTHVRRWLLLNGLEKGFLHRKHLPFLEALAQTCFLTEYVYGETAEEKVKVEALRRRVENAADAPPACDLALLAAYRPLRDLENAGALAAQDQDDLLTDLIAGQISEPLLEREIRKTIPALGAIENGTSRKVREMYEENPYPRWKTLSIASRRIHGAGDWLVAGCGTSRPTIQGATLFPDMRFRAVDLSLSSLSFGIRKAREMGVRNIEFAQCDILDLDTIGETYDMIDCSGVLHHMADPVAGWKKLLKVMKPGGRMNIGLYSAHARRQIALARDYVKQKGYPASLEGIRAFRHDIYMFPATHPLKDLFSRRDFYSTSECRDLVFHVQEKNYTLPELKQTLEDLGLTLLSLQTITPKYRALYKQRFQDDPDCRNMDYWDVLEREIPNMFIGMYQFICCRKEETDFMTPAAKAAIDSKFYSG